MMPASSTGTAADLALAPTQDIRSCVELARHFAERLAHGERLVVDAAAFQTGDITFVQVLIAARKSAQAQGGDIDICHANAALAALLDRCGLDAETLSHFVPGFQEASR